MQVQSVVIPQALSETRDCKSPVPIFFINRDRDTERLTYMQRQFAGLGIEASRISGVDGLDVPKGFRDYFFTSGAVSCGLSPGQIGCSASHFKALKLIADSKIDAALILEDDAILGPDLVDLLHSIIEIAPSGWDIIKLCRQSKRETKRIFSLPDNRTLVRYSRVPVGRAGYLVSVAGANKLLTPRKICHPGDVEIARPWLLGLDIYGVEPPPVSQDRDRLSSTIGLKRGRPHTRTRWVPDINRAAFNIGKLGILSWANCWVNNAIVRHWRQAR